MVRHKPSYFECQEGRGDVFDSKGIGDHRPHLPERKLAVKIMLPVKTADFWSEAEADDFGFIMRYNVRLVW